MSAHAQVSITATAGNTGPTSYANLRLAFAAVNDGTHQGAITLNITTSPGADNNTAVLNASGSGSANYTSILVQPEGSTGSRSIAGTVAGGPLVDLNGADNVTFDGRNGDGYELVISNQSTASSAGTSTIRFINDATDNTLRELSILGRATGTVAALSGNVVFSTGSSTGNDDNTIVGCIIANDGNTTTDLISKAIVSVGSTGSLALHNSGNVVEDCHIHDFFLAGGSRGILLGAGNHAWTISGNRFWQGGARTTAGNGSHHVVVDITSGSLAEAGGHVIAGNIIGFANAAGTGTWTLAGGSNSFRAIRVELDADAPASTISGNAIAGIDHTSTANGTGASSPSSIIHVLGGPVMINDNHIGSQSATGSILYTPSLGGRDLHAVLNSGSAPWSSHHNRIGGIMVANNGAFYALRSTGAGAWACDSNLVGGTVAGSIEASGTGSGSKMYGIAAEGAPLNAIGNIIRNMVSGGNALAHIHGISVTDATFTAEGNEIGTLACSGIDGIHGSNARATITANSINSLAGTHSGGGSPLVRGIYVSGDSATVINNSIDSLSNTATGSSTATYGIHCTSGVLTAQGNTIRAAGNSRLMVGIFASDAVLLAESNTISNMEARFCYGIQTLRSHALLTDNTIRGLSNSATTGNSALCGINATDSSLTAQGNNISHFFNLAATTGALTRGFQITNVSLHAEGNRIHHLSGNGSGSVANVGITGISINNTSTGTQVLLKGNTIHTLFSPHADNTGQVQGIRASLNDTTNVIEGNLVHSLWRATSSTTANNSHGIHLEAGTSTVRNNMVRLGLDSAGVSVSSPHVFQGIFVAAGEHAILHNSVYIGGTVTTAGTNHTHALFSNASGPRDHRNNILWNARSNDTGSSKHCAVRVLDLAGLVSDHNCLYVSGTGGVLAREGTTDRSTLSAWQSATSLDGNSVSTDPGLVRPDGDDTEVDLHIQHNSSGAAAISRAGATGTGVLHDYDGAQRQSPPDIGADQILLVLPDFFEEPNQATFNFWRNKGQVVDTEQQNPRSDVKFYTDRGLPRSYLRSSSNISFTHTSVDTSATTPDTTWRVDLRFTGGKEREVDPQAVDMRNPYRNYYLPWCGANGVTQVHGFGRVVYEDLYPFTDLHFYSGSGGAKLAFVIRPGGDYENIQMTFDGQDSLTVDGFDVLHAHVAGWDFPLVGGIAYQVDGGGGIVPLGMTSFLNSAGSPVVDLGMSLMGYDPELPLVIQVGWPPMMSNNTEGVCWSTYFGGDGRDVPTNIEMTRSGVFYVSGHTTSSEVSFPTVVGVTTFNSGLVASLSKFFDTHDLHWSVYYGGSHDTFVSGLTVRDNDNESMHNIYISGTTRAVDLFLYAQSGAYNSSVSPPTTGYFLGFISKFDFWGMIEWGTYFGNECSVACNLFIHGLDIFEYQQSSDIVIVGLHTGSIPSPVVNPPSTFVQYPLNGTTNSDGFIARFDSNDQLFWSTTIGGSLDDSAVDIGCYRNQIIVAGRSLSSNLPLVYLSGGYNQSYAGFNDSFIWEFNHIGQHIWGTYYGGTGLDGVGIPATIAEEGIGNPLGINQENGSIYIVGTTGSTDLPMEDSGGWFNPTPGSSTPSGNINYSYIARFNIDRELVWSSYLGTTSFRAESVYPTADGKVLVGVSSGNGVQLTPVPYANLYYEPTPYMNSGLSNQAGDAMILLFDEVDNMLWATFYGGPSVGPERIFDFTSNDYEYFVIGNHGKHNSDFNTYFPLYDSGGYYDDTYNDVGTASSDMFISSFCYPIEVGIATDRVNPWMGMVVHPVGGGLYEVGGLDGDNVVLWNVLGQRLQEVININKSSTLLLNLNGSSDGIYIVQTETKSRKFVHNTLGQ